MNCGTTIHKVYGNHVPCLHVGTAVQHTVVSSGNLPFTGLNLLVWFGLGVLVAAIGVWLWTIGRVG